MLLFKSNTCSCKNSNLSYVLGIQGRQLYQKYICLPSEIGFTLNGKKILPLIASTKRKTIKTIFFQRRYNLNKINLAQRLYRYIFSMLNSAEHEISSVNKFENANNSVWHLHNFVRRESFMLSDL